MKREYSDQEMKRILQQEIEIPGQVEQGIQDAYRKIGAENVGRRHSWKYHKIWKVVAAAAVLTAGSSFVVFAANHFLSVNLITGEDSVKYELQIDRNQDAHEIKVTPGYMPEGYVYGDETSAYGGKWHNEETDGIITIIPYNASELDELIRLGDAEQLTHGIKEENLKEETDISGMKTSVFVTDSEYIDSENTTKRLFLFNEEDGYLIEIISYSDLPEKELLKVAEGLEIQILDSVVPYKTEEEINIQLAKREEINDEKEMSDGAIAQNCFFAVGDELKNPYAKALQEDLRYTVESIEVKDTLMLDEYPMENYVNYEEAAQWINEDGSLKPHERRHDIIGENGEIAESVVETVSSKYVVVKMKLKNANKVNPCLEYEAFVAPYLKNLSQNENGNWTENEDSYLPANEEYMIQTDGLPVYFDQRYYTDGIEGLKHALFLPMEPGEETEYTLVYIVDEDRLDSAFLQFYSGMGSADGPETDNAEVYVKVLQ